MNLAPVLAVRVVHLLALALAVGAATAKNLLLYRCRRDPTFVPTFLRVEGPITKQIITGQVLLTVTGIVYALLLGFGFTPRLVVKLVLFGLLWVLGPIIDNVIGPRFRKTAPAPGEAVTPEFRRALDRYLLWDVTASGLYYAIIVLWVTTS